MVLVAGLGTSVSTSKKKLGQMSFRPCFRTEPAIGFPDCAYRLSPDGTALERGRDWKEEIRAKMPASELDEDKILRQKLPKHVGTRSQDFVVFAMEERGMSSMDKLDMKVIPKVYTSKFDLP